MSWIEFHSTLPTHPKTYALADALKIPRAQAIGHLSALWLWAIDNAESGNLTEFSEKAIADVCLWPRRDAPRFVAGMKETGWLDGDGQIHNWDKYAGKLLDKRRTDRERKAEVRRKSAGSPSDGAGNRTVPDKTVPDRTEPVAAATARDPEVSKAMRAVENLTGSLTQPVSEAVLAELDVGTSADWIVAACEVSALANVRHWNHTAAVIARWKIDGFKADRRQHGRSDKAGKRDLADSPFAKFGT